MLYFTVEIISSELETLSQGDKIILREVAENLRKNINLGKL